MTMNIEEARSWINENWGKRPTAAMISYVQRQCGIGMLEAKSLVDSMIDGSNDGDGRDQRIDDLEVRVARLEERVEESG